MSLFRPAVDRVQGYVPGEQPQDSGWIKLNTNENPYPPSPRVVEALHTAIHGRLNLYPDPLATAFRKVVAREFHVDPDWVLPANGSDENLTLIVRSFIDPPDLVVYPYPSYILYETLVDLQGGQHARAVLQSDWSWDWDRTKPLVERAKLVMVPNPNSPSGNRWPDADLERLVPPRGVLLLDEAYGDFADRPHRGELLHTSWGNRLIITRSLSKSYSLAGIRVGFALAHPDLIAGMRKMKDSYNCDSLSLAAAAAALEDRAWMEQNAARIRATRGTLTGGLRALRFDVVPSQTNFVWATHPEVSAQVVYERLKAQRILVRCMAFGDGAARVSGLRITVGTEGETAALLEALGPIVGAG